MRQRISYVELVVCLRERWDHFSAQNVLDFALGEAGLRKQALYEAADVRKLARALAKRKKDRVEEVVARLDREADRLESVDLGESPLA